MTRKSEIEATKPRLVVLGAEIELGDEVVTVPSENVVLILEGEHPRNVLIDGRLTRMSAGKSSIVLLNLSQSTGFHRIQVNNQTYWFATEDAKLGLDGLEQMLQEMTQLGTGWTGQAMFSDGSSIRDTHVVYAWLDQWADVAIKSLDEVFLAPSELDESIDVLSRVAKGRVNVASTLRLVRSNPRGYLNPNPNGAIAVGVERFDPLRFVIRGRQRTMDTTPNRRAAELVRQMKRLVEEVVANDPNTSVRTRCRTWVSKLEQIESRPLVRRLRHRLAGSAPRHSLESIDHRYRKTFDASNDLRRSFGWSAQTEVLKRYSYLQRMDLIYQAYVASCVAKSLGMCQVSPVLGGSGVAFQGAGFDLYYDSIPPPHVLRSWRFGSLKPDESRPDLLLHETSTGRVAILDAKYRVDDGRATEDSRKEVESYLNLYGLRTISIVYPGTGSQARRIEGHGMNILELPLAPPFKPHEFGQLLSEVLNSLEFPRY